MTTPPTPDPDPAPKITDIRCHRRWYWAFGWEFRYGDWSPKIKGELLPFGHIWLGFFRLAKDTDEPWWRGWTFHWNRD